MANSVVIGDDISDVLAARHLGCVGYLVPTGWGEKSIRERAADLAAHHVAADVLEAAQWVVSGILGGSR